MNPTDQLPPPPPPPAPSRHGGRFTNEVMAGGSVVEKTDDELVGGWRGAIGVTVIIAMPVAAISPGTIRNPPPIPKNPLNPPATRP